MDIFVKLILSELRGLTLGQSFLKAHTSGKIQCLCRLRNLNTSLMGGDFIDAPKYGLEKVLHNRNIFNIFQRYAEINQIHAISKRGQYVVSIILGMQQVYTKH